MSVSGKCVKRRVFNMADRDTEGRKTLSATVMTMQHFVLQYVQVELGREWPSFFFLFGGRKFTHAQYIKI